MKERNFTRDQKVKEKEKCKKKNLRYADSHRRSYAVTRYVETLFAIKSYSPITGLVDQFTRSTFRPVSDKIIGSFS